VLPEPGSVQYCINEYKRSVEWRNSLKPITQRNYALYLRVWEHASLAHLKVAEITRRQIRTVRSSIAETRGISAANVFVRVTASWFRWLLDNDWVEYSPVASIKPVEGGQELPTWTEEQFIHAERTFPELLRRAIVLARYTGQRRGDLINMRWSDDKGDVLTVTQAKGRKGRAPVRLSIPIHPVLRAELDAWKADTLASFSRHILTHSRSRPWYPTNLSNSIKAAVADAKLPRRLNIHGLRKLAATSLAELGCSSHEIASITGHRTLAMIEKYTRAVSQADLARRAMDKWEQGSRKR
jgi:integrase